MEEETSAFYSEASAAGKGFDFRTLRLRLDRITSRETVADAPERQSLVEFIETVKKQREQSKQFKPNTLKSYQTLINHLKGFEEKHKASVPLADVDIDFFYSFTDYLFKGGPNLSTNTVSKTVQVLRTFLGEARDRGIDLAPSIQSGRFRIPPIDTHKIYLSEGELAEIEALEIEPGHRLERVRDLFLLACSTGLRYSDLSQIKAENFRERDGVTLLSFSQTKTDDPVTIPVNERAKRILQRYGYQAPALISNQKYNRYLKELCQIAGIKTRVLSYEFSGGQRKEVVKEKWELITTHTARRTFATNAHKAGVPTLVIAKITGHRTEKTLLQYIRLTSEENAMLASKNPFFKE